MPTLSRNKAIPLEPMRVSMDFNWETFPQYMDRLERLPLGINISHLFPISPAVASAGICRDTSRFPPLRKDCTAIPKGSPLWNSRESKCSGASLKPFPE